MRKIWILAAVVGLLAWGVQGWGLSLCEYRSPQTSLVDARLSFGYRYFDDPSSAGVDVSSGRLAVSYSQLFDSPGYGFSLGGGAEMTLADFAPTGWLGRGSATFRYYLMEDGLWFGFGGVEGSMATGQPLPGVDVRVGVGVGRFSDVTPLAKAVTIDRQLRVVKALESPLADDVLRGIGEVIGRRIEYEEIKDLVADIELLIETSSSVELDARALLTIEEIVLATGDERQCGWAVQVGIGYELIDPSGGDRNVVVGGSADAAFACGPNDQLLFRASYAGPFDLLNDYTANASLGYQNEFAPESKLIVDYALLQVKPAGLPASASHSAGVALAFDVRGVDLLIGASFTRQTGAPGWSIDISVSAAMELL